MPHIRVVSRSDFDYGGIRGTIKTWYLQDFTLFQTNCRMVFLSSYCVAGHARRVNRW
jgi:hypothetical protein